MITKSKGALRASVGSLLFAALAMHSAAANAETSEDRTEASGQAAGPDYSLQEIIVTANKREESINKVGLTIKALGAAQLEQQHISSLQDLAAAVPGLQYAQTENATPVYTLRGIGYYDTTIGAPPAVSVYIDQAPLAYPVMTTRALFDLERVEVLKGPQGTLFGNNATGGAINYIAAKPTKDPSAGLNLTYGSFNTFTGESYVSGPISDNLLGRIAVSATSGDGWQRSATRPDDRNGAPDALAARFLLDWNPTDRLRIQTNLNGWRDRTQPTATQFVEYIPNFRDTIPYPIPNPDIPNATNNPRVADWSPDDAPKADNRLLQATLRADYDVTHQIAFTSLTAYADYKQSMTPEGDGLVQQRNDIRDFDGYIRSFSQEIRLANNNDPTFRWTVGGNYSKDRIFDTLEVLYKDGTSAYSQGSPVSFGSTTPGGWASNGSSVREAAKTYAGFANAEYTLGTFTLKGGARYTEADRDAVNCLFALNDNGQAVNHINTFFSGFASFLTGTPVTITPGQCLTLGANGLPHAVSGTLNQNNVSWGGGVDWKPMDGILAYANVSKGYKAGSFGNFGGAFDSQYTPTSQESVVTYEGGFKTQLFDRKLSLNGAVFYSDYKDKQIKSKRVDPLFGALLALVNVPKSQITGFELEGAVHPVTGLTIGGAVTYLDANITDATDRTDPAHGNLYTLAGVRASPGDHPIPYASKWTAQGNINYSFAIGSQREAFVAAQIMHTTSTNASIGGENGEIINGYAYDFTIPGYTMVDAQVGVNFAGGKYRVMVWGKNITNEFYITNRNDSFDGIAQWAGRPATYGVTIGAKF